MAYNHAQNAAKCLRRANAECQQAAKEADTSGSKTDGNELRKIGTSILGYADKFEKSAGGSGGPPAKKPSKSSTSPTEPEPTAE